MYQMIFDYFCYYTHKLETHLVAGQYQQHHYNVKIHDDVIKWKHFPRSWPFVWGIHRSPVNSPHKGQWRVALVFSLICAWIKAWVNNCEVGDLRRHRTHYDVIVMGENDTTSIACTVPLGRNIALQKMLPSIVCMGLLAGSSIKIEMFHWKI